MELSEHARAEQTEILFGEEFISHCTKGITAYSMILTGEMCSFQAELHIVDHLALQMAMLKRDLERRIYGVAR